MLTLGKYPQMTVAQAHAAYGDAVHKLEEGYDPSTVPLNQRRDTRKSKVIKDLSEEYLEEYLKPKRSERTYEEYNRIHEHDLYPAIGKMKAKAVKRKDIKAIIKKVVERGSPVQANRTFAVVRRFFNHLVEEEEIEFSPCNNIRTPSKEQRRDRVLWDDELISFFKNIEKAKMSEVSRNALKLLLYTGQRPGEIVSLEWNDLDFSNKWWNMPPEKSKNKQGHEIPLTNIAVELLHNARTLSGDSKWVFPSPRFNGENHMLETALARSVSRNLDVLGVERFTPHDLRRTVASHIASLGFPDHVLKRILNHKEKSVTAIYNRYDYAPEKRDALDAWENKLVKLKKSD